ncbi:MAG: OmpA family protein [Spirochaetales bacterium]|nr:OmpA family protein [Spirochaetales bacterium]
MPENKEQLLEADLKQCQQEQQELGNQRTVLENQNKELEDKVADLNKQIAYLKEHNTATLKHLESMSVISSSQADSIRKSLDSLGAKDAYIQNIQDFMARKDAMNMNLVLNLKGALGNEQAEEIEIKVDKGVVFIDLSDKLLFRSGSHELTAGAKTILGKVARVLKEQPGMEIMIEGHTDNVPYSAGVLRDNWDLSVKRSTAIVRLLQNSYGLSPARLIAAGRGEYKPIASNDDAAGRASNRRTRITILPELDQFFQLLEPKSQ